MLWVVGDGGGGCTGQTQILIIIQMEQSFNDLVNFFL